jgi:hypothetical protein
MADEKRDGRRTRTGRMAALMGDLTDPRLMYLKAFLFGVIGMLCAAGILAEAFSWRVALLLALCIWSFCRLYYFAFYVIEHYIDPGYKFAGIFPAVRHVMVSARNRETDPSRQKVVKEGEFKD